MRTSSCDDFMKSTHPSTPPNLESKMSEKQPAPATSELPPPPSEQSDATLKDSPTVKQTDKPSKIQCFADCIRRGRRHGSQKRSWAAEMLCAMCCNSYHLNCVGLRRNHGAPLRGVYVCPDCTGVLGELQLMAKRRNSVKERLQQMEMANRYCSNEMAKLHTQAEILNITCRRVHTLNSSLVAITLQQLQLQSSDGSIDQAVDPAPTTASSGVLQNVPNPVNTPVPSDIGNVSAPAMTTADKNEDDGCLVSDRIHLELEPEVEMATTEEVHSKVVVNIDEIAHLTSAGEMEVERPEEQSAPSSTLEQDPEVGMAMTEDVHHSDVVVDIDEIAHLTSAGEVEVERPEEQYSPSSTLIIDERTVEQIPDCRLPPLLEATGNRQVDVAVQATESALVVKPNDPLPPWLTPNCRLRGEVCVPNVGLQQRELGHEVLLDVPDGYVEVGRSGDPVTRVWECNHNAGVLLENYVVAMLETGPVNPMALYASGRNSSLHNQLTDNPSANGCNDKRNSRKRQSVSVHNSPAAKLQRHPPSDHAESGIQNKAHGSDPDLPLHRTDFPSDWLYCIWCNKNYFHGCREHMPHRILDAPVTIVDWRRAFRSCPTVLDVASNNQCGATSCCQRVITKVLLPKGIIFGPLVGRYNDKVGNLESALCWRISRQFKPPIYVDTRNPVQCNWMKFVRFARPDQPHNVEAFQYKTEIFFRTVCDIAAGSELFVWYSYAYFMNEVAPLINLPNLIQQFLINQNALRGYSSSQPLMQHEGGQTPNRHNATEAVTTNVV